MPEEYEARIEEQLYEAAVIPDMWPNALDAVARAGGAEGAVLFTVGRGGMKWAASDRVRDTMRRFVEDGWASRNPRVKGVIDRGLVGIPRFVTEKDYFTPGQSETEPMIQELLVPRGFGWAAGTLISMPDDDIITFSIEKDYRRGPIAGEALHRLNLLRPHIARASMFASRMALDRMRSQVDILGALGLAAAAVTKTGKVVAANADFEAETHLWTIRAGNKVGLASASLNAVLSETLSRLGSTLGQRSIPLRDSDGTLVAALQVVPVRNQAHDYFQAAHAVLVINRASNAREFDPRVVQALFDLSAAESEVAAGLLRGRKLDEIAATRGVSMNTIRSQLKSAMAKTGCQRQADLILLVGTVFSTAIL